MSIVVPDPSSDEMDLVLPPPPPPPPPPVRFSTTRAFDSSAGDLNRAPMIGVRPDPYAKSPLTPRSRLAAATLVSLVKAPAATRQAVLRAAELKYKHARAAYRVERASAARADVVASRRALTVRDDCANAALEVHVETRAYIDDAKYRLELMDRAIHNRWISVVVELGRDDADFASNTMDEFVLAFERVKREAENAYVHLPGAVAIVRSMVDDAESAASRQDKYDVTWRVNAAITTIVGLNTLVDACRNAYDDVVFAATHMARAGASIDLDVIASILKLGPIGVIDTDRISSAMNVVGAHTRAVAKLELLDSTGLQR